MIVRKEWLEVHLWLKRRVDDPRFHRIELIPKHDWIHHLRLRDPSQLDDGLLAIVREAYLVGNQEFPG